MVGAHILLMGSPGSGKSTFSEYLVKTDRFYHLCLGDILRKQVDAQTPEGLEFKKLLANGKLIPTASGIKIFEEYFKKGEQEGKRVIIDGLVQNNEYASYFKQFFTDKKVYFVFLKASREICEMRLRKRQALEGRVDDQNPEVVNRRLDRFFNETIKFVDYFRGESTFMEIDSEDLIDNLKPLYRKLFA